MSSWIVSVIPPFAEENLESELSVSDVGFTNSFESFDRGYFFSGPHLLTHNT